ATLQTSSKYDSNGTTMERIKSLTLTIKDVQGNVSSSSSAGTKAPLIVVAKNKEIRPNISVSTDHEDRALSIAERAGVTKQKTEDLRCIRVSDLSKTAQQVTNSLQLDSNETKSKEESTSRKSPSHSSSPCNTRLAREVHYRSSSISRALFTLESDDEADC